MYNQAGSQETMSFWQDVDPSVTGKLDDLQKSAIMDAVKRRSNDQHKADIRLSLFGYFLVVLFGRERRSNQRLKEERRKRPVVTLNNLLVLGVLWGSVIYTLYSLLPRLLEFVLRLIL
ncbi:MAG: hypothetical protein JJ979_13460 [Roseibium sp.]|nr:hypothetical protein [Roseibium sp.]